MPTSNPIRWRSGDVKLFLLKRGERYAVRTKDNQSPLRTSFAGLRWYPPREEWRIQAAFVPHAVPTKLKLDTIVGETEAMDSPGYVTFERDGKTYRLDAAGQKNGTLWFVFRDRHQRADDPRRSSAALRGCSTGWHVSCSISTRPSTCRVPIFPYATCPLAPPQNRLSLAIEAGELKYEPARADHSPGESLR